jgi:hypothetical protein
MSDTTWKKAAAAAEDWCGDVSTKTLYRAVRKGELKAARIGAGRNLLFCKQWCEEWLHWCATRPYAGGEVAKSGSTGPVIVVPDRRRA